MKQILIYEDEGVGQKAFCKLVSALKKSLHPEYELKAVNHRFFFAPDWDANASLLIFPGGRDTPYHKKLQGTANSQIRSYIERGGRYLGICAGGYYGASSIEFEKGEALEICALRELGFFPGKAIGPAYGVGVFSYESDRSARAAQISWENGISWVYYLGGCYFEAPEKYPEIQIIARYHDLPGSPAAAVYCPVGRGAALLMGIHPEYGILFKKNCFWSFVLNKILN